VDTTSKNLNRMFRLKDVEQFVGLKRTQIRELMKAGEFPRPVGLSDSGRAIAWLEHELIAWQADRTEARDRRSRSGDKNRVGPRHKTREGV
jgi:predicted DNA-binding transcriptional regulator AlpA